MHGTFDRKLDENETIALYLERAKSLIQDPDDWLQRDYKKDNRRCAAQAVRDVLTYGVEDNYYMRAMTALAGENYFGNEPESAVCNFNDGSSHGEVMNRFDNTINRLRSLSVLRNSI